MLKNNKVSPLNTESKRPSLHQGRMIATYMKMGNTNISFKSIKEGNTQL